MRETLDLLGKLFQYRTCEGPEPGRRSGVPCLDYYIKRCQAPCVGYIDQEEYRGNIDRIIDFLSGRYREVTDDLEARMAEAAEAQDFERAALFRDRLTAVSSLMERQRVAGRSMGSADLIGVAVEGADANAQVFQVRDGVLAERQGFYLGRRRGARARGGGRELPAPVLHGGPRDPGRAWWSGPSSRAGPRCWRRRSEPSATRRSRSGSPSGATSAACASWPSATPSWRWPRTACGASTAASSGPRR